jgi:uncharacterized repeat protein (TIGR03803 family)
MTNIKLNAFTFLLIVIFLLPTHTYGQYTKIFEFKNNVNGNDPKGALITDGTYLFGMTSRGGAHNFGTIFKIKLDGTSFTKLYDFDSINGTYPYGALLLDGANLYGMAQYGGVYNSGTIFKIDTNSSNFTKLFDFSSSTGMYPQGSLVSDGANLYGMASSGGIGFGTIFKIAKSGSGYTKLKNFNGGPSAYPQGSLFYDGSYLYGTTFGEFFSSTTGGSIFKLTTNGLYTNLKTLGYTESCTGNLISDGNYLYGVAGCFNGGTNSMGKIFKITSSGSITYLKEFYDTDSMQIRPTASLVYDGNYLYGIGGQAIFKIKSNGTNFKIIDRYHADGNDNVLMYGDYLYGMTEGDIYRNIKSSIFKFAYKLTLPIVTTDSVVNISPTYAKLYGSLTNNGADMNASRGFCYSISPNPTITDTTINCGFGQGLFTGNLNPNKTYYIRAYSTNSIGTSYGNQIKLPQEKEKGSNSIFPNPTKSIVNIVLDHVATNVSFRIVNIQGQTIIDQTNLNGDTFSVDLSNQANGMYILEVIENNATTRSKIFKIFL